MATKAQMEKQVERLLAENAALKTELSETSKAVSVTVNIKLPEQLRDRYKAYATGSKMSMRGVMELALTEWLDGRKDTQPDQNALPGV